MYYFSDFATNDGSTRLLELAQEFENVFPTHDLSGQRVTAVHSHYRMLTAGCPTTFVKPNCEGSCTSCSGKVAKAKCKARQLKCKGRLISCFCCPLCDVFNTIIQHLDKTTLLKVQAYKVCSYPSHHMRLQYCLLLHCLIFYYDNPTTGIGFPFSKL